MNGANNASRTTAMSNLVLAIVASLLLVYSLPHLIALRNVLLWTGFFLVLPATVRFVRGSSPVVLIPVVLLGLVVSWAFVVALFIAHPALPSLAEWKAEWLPPAVAFFFGLGISVTECNRHGNKGDARTLLALVVPLIVLMLAHLGAVVVSLARDGHIAYNFPGVSDHKANVTYAGTMLLAVVLAATMAHLTGRRTISQRNMLAVSVVLAILLAAIVTSGARNGVVVAVFGLVFAVAWYSVSALSRKETYKRAIVVVGVLSMVLLVVVWSAIRWDSRWQTLIRTIPVALDTERHQEWLDMPKARAPLTDDGLAVERTAYMRLAWAKEGVKLLTEHLWGTQISRNTFQDLMRAKFGRMQVSHPHNGWLEYGLNTGLPGLILWSAFLLVVAVSGLRSYRHSGNIAGSALALLIMFFALRMCLDSTMRDHILEEFLLVTGALLGLVENSTGNTDTLPA